jgi:hypothetical protein
MYTYNENKNLFFFSVNIIFGCCPCATFCAAASTSKMLDVVIVTLFPLKTLLIKSNLYFSIYSAIFTHI